MTASPHTPFFSLDDHAALMQFRPIVMEIQADGCTASAAERMQRLQRMLMQRLIAGGSALHPCWERAQQIVPLSFASSTPIDGFAFAFTRAQSQAAVIERMMGRRGGQDASRHPVLEVRLTREHLVAEIIVSPMARLDQCNLMGKLRIERHRTSLRGLLAHGGGMLRLGFWHGERLNDSHLTCRELLQGEILSRWFDTFAPEHEWLRIGVWIEPGMSCIETELSRFVMLLSRIYTFFAWTSSNSFHQNDTRMRSPSDINPIS
jgi:hypothetical protein